MQTAAMTSRLLTGCSSKVGFADSEIAVRKGGFIEHILVSHLAQTAHSQGAFLKLTNRLIHYAEHAYMLRDADALEEVSRILMSLPIAASRQIGLYYHALAITRKGQRVEAASLLETVADTAPVIYRARALQTLGANHHDRGQFDEALRFQLEALRVAPNKNAHGVQTTLMAHTEISHVKSDTGDHKGALAILDSLSPLVRIVGRRSPLYFYGYHNELAVEFAELGRLGEAEAASAISLASPFAPAYPEWSETRDEIAAKRDSANPSVVAIARATEADASRQIQPEHEAVRVSSLAVNSPARRLARKDCFQRSLVPIAPSRAIAQVGITKSILKLVLCLIAPRAPPALS